MTNKSVNDFLQKVSSDERLQQELTQVLQSAENDREAAVALAEKKGYKLSAEELWQEIQNRQSSSGSNTSSDELNDEALEAVAGGGIGTIVMSASMVTPSVKW